MKHHPAVTRTVQWSQDQWQALSARERLISRIALALVLAALVWGVGIAPALKTLQQAQQQLPVLRAQVQAMQTQAQQAAALRMQPTLSAEQRQAALAAAQRRVMPSANKETSATKETPTTAALVLVDVPPDLLAQWLIDVRSNAHATPTEATLSRNAQGNWSGSVTLNQP